MYQNQPDIRNFDSYANRGNPLAEFNYMGVLPTLNACNGVLSNYGSMRKNGLKLTKVMLDAEMAAYMAIKNNKYVTTNYSWQR